MSSEGRFTYAKASVNIPRSKFPLNQRVTCPYYHGDLIPLQIYEAMPGDTFSSKVSYTVRMATPIAPIMDNIYLSVACFLVPKRLVNNNIKKFYGENEEGYGIQSDILLPRSFNEAMTQTLNWTRDHPRTLGTYLGLVRQNNSFSSDIDARIALDPIRAFYAVYNEWFRNENFMAPYLWNHNQTGDSNFIPVTRNGENIFPNGESSLPKVCKKLDRFTSCLPWTQKCASDITLPLAGSAPVSLYLESGVAPSSTGEKTFTSIWGTLPWTEQFKANNEPARMKADLLQATSVTINQFRIAVQTMKYYETLARVGSKYREFIQGIFGVQIGDVTAQMPEYLGGISKMINMATVLSQSGYQSGATTTLGMPGGYSQTNGSNEALFTKSVTEPSYVIVVAYTKHDRTYGQGIDEIFTKHELFDFYNPKFACIGEQPVKESSIYFTGKSSDSDNAFGFNEAWSEYRHLKDRTIGALNPAIPGSLNYWNLGDNFTEKPVLNADFLTEDRKALARCLSTGESGPDFLMDFYFETTAVRPMPLYSIPGLVDHF